MIHGSSVGVEHVMDWQNNVALLCSGGFSWRFVNTETGLSSAAVTANHARFLKLGTDDGDVFAPSSFSASVILGFSTLQKGKLILSAFSGENPFRALLVYPSAAIEISPSSTSSSVQLLACCAKNVSAFIVGGCIMWLSWKADKHLNVSYQEELKVDDPHHTGSVFATSVQFCKSDRLVVGYADGSLSFFSKSGVVGVASLRNCSGPIVELFRISSRCMAAVVQESLERVRLFVIHSSSQKSVEIVASFPFTFIKPRPVSGSETQSPMRPLVVQIAVGSLRACYLANFAPAVLLIESHVIDQEADPVKTAPLVSASFALDKIFTVDSPIAEISFLKFDRISFSCMDGKSFVRDI